MIMLFAILLANITLSQTNFKWDKVDSVNKTKSQIYSDTKIFIAQTWKSAQNVIQNDDKEDGNILIKGNCIKTVLMAGGMQQFRYVYNYSITFRMKDGKYKISLDNVYCESATFMTNPSYTIVKIEPFEGDNCPPTGTMSNAGISKKKAILMMPELKQDLEDIVNSYEKYIKTPSSTNSGW